MYAASNQAAIERIAHLVEENRIDCDLRASTELLVLLIRE
jgi:hypothetical protein